MNEFETKLYNECKQKIGIELNEEKLNAFKVFMDDVLTTNEAVNLTRIVEPNEFLMKHYIDSLEMFHVKQFKDKLEKCEKIKIIDVGTGAGFPGIPLAIALKNTENELVLTDSLNKRINFLQKEIEKLKLNNVKIIHARAEDLAQDKNHREQYDIAVSRGVAKIQVLSEYLLPFVKVGGFAGMYKLADIEQELNEGKNAIKLLGGQDLAERNEYSLDENEPKRCIVLVRKVEKTSGKYPRKSGTPAKTPLK